MLSAEFNNNDSHLNTHGGVSNRRPLVIWAFLCALAGLTLIVYISMSLSAGRGNLLMPLDDAYIHFQYARQIAAGEFYSYNPGLPPTSGATSFLYPYILAVGYLIGFQGLLLGLWAMSVGAVALVLSGGLIYALGRALNTGWGGVIIAVAFMINGATAWHFMSGMETGLVMLFVLVTLYGLIAQRNGVAILGAATSALLRPEGAILAVLVSLFLLIKAFNAKAQTKQQSARRWVGAFIPSLAIGLQPLTNVLVTGSAVATGNSAKSLFGVVPFDLAYVIGRIWENFIRMWREFFAFDLPGDARVYLGVVVALMAFVGFVRLIWRRERRGLGVLIGVWLVGMTLAISTLDTAFWHFKRYQMPMIAVFFLMAVVGLSQIEGRKTQHKGTETQRHEGLWRLGTAILGVSVLIIAMLSSVDFLRSYIVNVGYVYAQPYQMGLWLRDNEPPDTVVAVHDVGMMRYIGGHTTLDIVGLTTASASDYWRNGPGAVAELIIRERPDLIASYGMGHGLGLGYLQGTDLYANPQAQYTVTTDNTRNVALAADTQGIYIPDYTAADNAETLSVLPQIYPELFENAQLRATINVGDLESEREHGYQWSVQGALGGFPTEFYQFGTFGCVENCAIMDGGRRINGAERFRLTPVYADNGSLCSRYLLVTRVHAAQAGRFTVFSENEAVATRVIPLLPGTWVEIPTIIGLSNHNGQDGFAQLRVVPDGLYMPYRHYIYDLCSYQDVRAERDNTRAYWQDTEIRLQRTSSLTLMADQMQFALDWYTPGGAQGDYAFFIHLYAVDDLNTIVKQYDSRPGRGMLPPGNWLPGGFRDTVDIDISDVASGAYRIAVGLYDPYTFERLMPFSGDEQGRFWLGNVNIP